MSKALILPCLCMLFICGGCAVKTKSRLSKKETRKWIKKNINFQTIGHPGVKSAKVRVRFVDDKTVGKTKIPAHFEYDLIEGATWK